MHTFVTEPGKTLELLGKAIFVADCVQVLCAALALKAGGQNREKGMSAESY